MAHPAKLTRVTIPTHTGSTSRAMSPKSSSCTFFYMPSFLWHSLWSSHVPNGFLPHSVFFISHISTSLSYNSWSTRREQTKLRQSINQQAYAHELIWKAAENTLFLCPQQLCTDVYNYKVLNDYQVNLYVAPDGSKPFQEAPDSQRAVCSWRPM